MEKEFVTYEQALALKELGFDYICPGYYVDKDTLIYNWIGHDRLRKFIMNYSTIAPLYQQAFRFFRVKYGLYHFIEKDDDRFNAVVQSAYVESFGTYEQAEQAALDKLIEIAKESKQ